MWEVLIDWLTSQHILETNVFWCVKEEKGIRVIKHRLQPITFLANMFSFDFVQLSEERSAAKISNMHSQYRLVGPVFGRFLPCGLAAHCGNVCFHYRARIYFETVLAYQKRPLYYWLQSTCLLTLMSLKVCLQWMGVVWRWCKYHYSFFTVCFRCLFFS